MLNTIILFRSIYQKESMQVTFLNTIVNNQFVLFQSMHKHIETLKVLILERMWKKINILSWIVMIFLFHCSHNYLPQLEMNFIIPVKGFVTVWHLLKVFHSKSVKLVNKAANRFGYLPFRYCKGCGNVFPVQFHKLRYESSGLSHQYYSIHLIQPNA